MSKRSKQLKQEWQGHFSHAKELQEVERQISNLRNLIEGAEEIEEIPLDTYKKKLMKLKTKRAIIKTKNKAPFSLRGYARTTKAGREWLKTKEK